MVLGNLMVQFLVFNDLSDCFRVRWRTPASALHRPTGEKYRQTVELRIDTVSVFEGRFVQLYRSAFNVGKASFHIRIILNILYS